jgi:hypothetical protein
MLHSKPQRVFYPTADILFGTVHVLRPQSRRYMARRRCCRGTLVRRQTLGAPHHSRCHCDCRVPAEKKTPTTFMESKGGQVERSIGIFDDFYGDRSLACDAGHAYRYER